MEIAVKRIHTTFPHFNFERKIHGDEHDVNFNFYNQQIKKSRLSGTL